MIFTDKKGREIELSINDMQFTIDAFHNSDLIGGFVFSYIEEPNFDYLLVTKMFLDKKEGYLRAGIGTKIIEVAQDTFGYNVGFREDDGIVRSDTSHLTGDGPAFTQSFKVD